jgi:signal transduction histidine kinase
VAAISQPDPPAVSEQLQEISKTASEAIEEVRAISHNLRPYQLDRLGLTKALQALLNQLAASTSIAFHAEIEPIDGVFPADTEINVYRIVQESLNNILKHSAAKRTSVVIHREDDHVCVTIEDDGRGFDYDALLKDPTRKRGLGLTGLAERARIMNGDLKIESTPGQGTRLTFIVRVSPSDAANAPRKKVLSGSAAN